MFSSILSKVSIFSVGRSSSTEAQSPSETEEWTPVEYERHYKDGAAVSSHLGNGLVHSFRKSDGIYKVLLIDWKAIAYFQKDSLGYQIAKGCKVGQPVLTMYGFSGTLSSVEPTTGIHVVKVRSPEAVMYLQPSAVLQPLKAAVSESVSTLFGPGIIQKFRNKDSTYEIKLNCLNVMFSNGDAFDRIDNDELNIKSNKSNSWFWRYFSFR